MNYRFNDKNKIVCSNCNCEIDSSFNDRHSCYWIELEKYPIGMVAGILRGAFSRYNDLEKRIASSIWSRVKEKNRPKKIKKIKMFGATNVEIYERWCVLGDEVFNSN